MKKILGTVLWLVLLLMLFSCGGEDVEKVDKGPGEYTFHLMNAEGIDDMSLYEYEEGYRYSDYEESQIHPDAPKSLSLMILGDTYDLTYSTSSKRFGEWYDHFYYEKGGNARVWIDIKTEEISQFGIKYAADFSTSEEFLEWVQAEILVKEDIDSFTQVALDTYSYQFKDTKSGLLRYAVSYYPDYGQLWFTNSNPDWKNPIYEDLLEDLPSIKQELDDSGFMEKNLVDNVELVKISAGTISELFTKDGIAHACISYHVTVTFGKEETVIDCPESVAVRYKQ